jgi:hypothetical protein
VLDTNAIFYQLLHTPPMRRNTAWLFCMVCMDLTANSHPGKDATDVGLSAHSWTNKDPTAGSPSLAQPKWHRQFLPLLG